MKLVHVHVSAPVVSQLALDPAELVAGAMSRRKESTISSRMDPLPRAWRALWPVRTRKKLSGRYVLRLHPN